MKKYIYLFLAFIFTIQIQAQSTGSFDNSVVFDETDFSATRTLYYYVPTDYDANNTYKLIVGFRGGPHSSAGQFRDQLQPLSDLLDAIIVCPENSADFNNGTEENAKPLFNHTVEKVDEEYNIDLDFVYITGLSYGGRHTIIASMDDDSGPISDNIRGIIPFAPGINAENVADYNNSMRFPICTCIGSNDANFYDVAQTFHNNVIANGGDALFNEISGIGHTTDFATFTDEMMECFDFIESQYTTPVEEIENEISLSIFPNPSDGIINIQLDNSSNHDYSILVHNMLGQSIKEYLFIENNTEITGLESGVYFIAIKENDQQIAIEKVVIK